MSSRSQKDGAKSPGTSPGSGASQDPSSTSPAASTSEPSSEPSSEPRNESPAPDADAVARDEAMRAEEDAARERAEAEAAAAVAASASAAPSRARLQVPLGSDLTSVSVGGAEHQVDERGYVDVAPEHEAAVRILLAAHWPQDEDDE